MVSQGQVAKASRPFQKLNSLCRHSSQHSGYELPIPHPLPCGTTYMHATWCSVIFHLSWGNLAPTWECSQVVLSLNRGLSCSGWTFRLKGSMLEEWGRGGSRQSSPNPGGTSKWYTLWLSLAEISISPAKLVTKLECRRKLRCREDGD